MKVVYRGRDKVLLTEYNGKRYCFRKDIPVEIMPEIYQAILTSGHISAAEVLPYEESEIYPDLSLPPEPMPEPKVEKPKKKKKSKK